MHPLIGDLSTLSDSELAKKISDLSTRLHSAQRSGNYDITNQISMILDSHLYENDERQRKIMEEIDKKMSAKLKKPTISDNDSYDIG